MTTIIQAELIMFRGEQREIPGIILAADATDEQRREFDRWRKAVRGLEGFTAVGNYRVMDEKPAA